MSTLVGKILVADDEESIRWVLATALSGEGHTVEQVDGGEAALARLLANGYDLALVDIKMADLDGLTVLSRAQEAAVATPIVIITAQNTMANAIEAMKRGAYDYVTKPFDIEEVQLLVQRALDMRRQTRNLARLEHETRKRFELGVELVGKTPAMQAIFKTIGRVAHTDATVLVQGESGTGKELIARALHSHSQRWGGPFVAVNCSAVPRDLLESELFGHERGAFTGATEQRPGVFETASGGTLFLDEIGDMPLELQAKLLRVLQERELSRIGGREVIKVDRRDDVPDLIAHFLAKINRDMGTRIEGISPEAQALLVEYNWPGNVRELENTLVRAAVLAPGATVMAHDLAIGAQQTSATVYDDLSLEEVVRLKLKDYFRQTRDVEPTDLYALIMERVERPLIELTLERTHGNQLKAAAILGINRNTLHKKITDLKITPKRRLGEVG